MGWMCSNCGGLRSHLTWVFSKRMDTTEQCHAVISHFNGKFIKIPSGALGRNKCPLFHSSLNTKCRVIVTPLALLLWLQLPLSHCCASLQTANARNTVTEDSFLMDRRVISDWYVSAAIDILCCWIQTQYQHSAPHPRAQWLWPTTLPQELCRTGKPVRTQATMLLTHSMQMWFLRVFLSIWRYYPTPYPMANRIMTVQPAVSPYMSSVPAYQVSPSLFLYWI